MSFSARYILLVGLLGVMCSSTVYAAKDDLDELQMKLSNQWTLVKMIDYVKLKPMLV